MESILRPLKFKSLGFLGKRISKRIRRPWFLTGVGIGSTPTPHAAK